MSRAEQFRATVECLHARDRLRVAILILENWYKASHNELEWAVRWFIDWKGGDAWIAAHPDILADTDNVFHARGFKIAAGWKPPRSVEYLNKILYIDDDRTDQILHSNVIT